MPSKNASTNDSSPFSFKSSKPHAAGEAQAPIQERTAAPGQEETAQQEELRKKRRARARAKEGSELFSAPADQQDDPGAAYGYRKSLFGHKDEVSVYTEQMDERHAMDRRTRTIAIALVAVIIAIPVFTVLPIGLFGFGREPLTIAKVIESFSSNVSGLINWLTGGPVTSGVSILFWQTLAVAVAGAALALNGCIFQGALKNALASPSTLGVMSGGTLGTLVFTLLFGIPAAGETVQAITASELRSQLNAMDIPTYIFATQGRALFSMAGCFIIVGLVLVIAHIAGRGKVSKVALLIAGQVFSALIAGVVAVIHSWVLFYGTVEQQDALQRIAGGSVSDIVNPVSLLALAVPVVIGAVIIMFMRQRLNLLAFNDDEAKSMGIKTTFTRNLVIVICTVLTGVVVSFVGAVGFVGFLVPHLARKVVGPDFRYLVPASMLFGALFLLIANYLMNLTSIFSGSLGTLTSLVGIVFFVVVVIRERARGNVDWI